MSRIDPRGISRKIVNVTDGTDCTLVQFDCGHTSRMATHFTFRVGADCRCHTCGVEAQQRLVGQSQIRAAMAREYEDRTSS